MNNERCNNCIWFDKCYDRNEDCEDYTPIDDTECDAEIDEIRDECQKYYLEQIEEQDN